MSKLTDKQEEFNLTIEELEETFKHAKKNNHNNMAKAIALQIEIMKEETVPKKSIWQRVSSIFSKRKELV